MKKNNRNPIESPIFNIFLTAVFVSLICLFFQSCAKPAKNHQSHSVRSGLSVFLSQYTHLVKDKKVGLITNPSGINSSLKTNIELFIENPEVRLIALYGTEHGVRGNAQPGEQVPYYYDEKLNLPVFSLYGQNRKPESHMLKNIDARMRSYDILKEGKIPDEDSFQDCDVLIFDIQDVGTRIYTYAATMAYCMEACAEQDIEFIVLDRPNPINGKDIEGSILEYPKFSSFVGLYPIPVRHGLTIGELSLLYNDRFLNKKAELTVIPMENWSREMWFDETGLPWVMPSPNMPSLETAVVYPGQVFLEGTNVSEGRGTTRPFELFGAPWIDGNELAKKMNSLSLPGIVFREAWFTPTFSKYSQQLCSGCQIHVIDRDSFQPFTTTLQIIQVLLEMYPAQFRFHNEYFDKIMGTSSIRESLLKKIPAGDILSRIKAELESFRDIRKDYLLYHP